MLGHRVARGAAAARAPGGAASGGSRAGRVPLAAGPGLASVALRRGGHGRDSGRPRGGALHASSPGRLLAAAAARGGAPQAAPGAPAGADDARAALATLAAALAFGALLGGAGVGLDPALPEPVQPVSAALGWSYFSAWGAAFFPQVGGGRAPTTTRGRRAGGPRAGKGAPAGAPPRPGCEGL
jgi:hypothetical protein